MVHQEKTLEWYVVEEEKGGGDEWPPVVVDETEDPNYVRFPQLQRLYRLIFIIALAYGIGGLLIWQQAEQQIIRLERELSAVRSELSQVADAMAMTGANAQSHRDIAESAAFAPYQFETTYLRFEASPETATTVTHILPLIDAKYLQLRRELGLPMDTVAPKVTLVIGGSPQSTEAAAHRIMVLGPKAVAELDNPIAVDALEKAAFSRLVIHALHEAFAGRTIKAPWQVMKMELYLYLLRENGDDAEWKVHEPYLARRRAAQEQSIDLLLQQALQSPEQSGPWPGQATLAEAMADPLIEFMLERYGYSHLPLLIDAFEEHTTWKALTPVVYGVGADEFEDAWHRYLRDTYPASG